MTAHEQSLLHDIRDGCLKISELVGARSEEQYSMDRDRQLAVERVFLIIGEAAVRLKNLSPERADAIVNLKGAIQFRNFLVHVYDQIQNPRVWQIATTDIPNLLREVQAMLPAEEDD